MGGEDVATAAAATGSAPVPASGTMDSPVYGALLRLHHAVQIIPLPAHAPGLRLVREEREHALRLLETYVLPRHDEREAPLVVVIGGPTGAGKSTLANSLVGARVSLSGVMRPTTREPVMVYHPLDAPALRRIGLLEGEAQAAPAPAATPGALDSVRPMPAPNEDIGVGLTVIDSPDLDSRLDGNREIAERLLSVADLWIYVTTGTDYADAMSWDVLQQVADRDISVAVVLNRMRPAEVRTVRGHFATLLRDAGLGHAYMFVMPEARLTDDRLPVQLMITFQRWLDAQAGQGREREAHLTRAREGTLDQVVVSVRRLADTIDDQAIAARRLRVDVEGVFSVAREAVRQRCSDGSLVVPELLAAWKAPAEAPAPTPGGTGLFRRRQRSREDTRTDPDAAIGVALSAGPTALLREQVDLATFRAQERRSAAQTGVQSEMQARLPQDFDVRLDQAIGDWLAAVHARVHAADEPGPGHDPVRDPLTVTVATLALLPRPGHQPDDTGSADPALIEELRPLVARRLAELGRADEASAMGQDAWLDLVSALTMVLSQEESRQIRDLQAAPLQADVADGLREHADDVARLRAQG